MRCGSFVYTMTILQSPSTAFYPLFIAVRCDDEGLRQLVRVDMHAVL